jgi:hypothetical protein
MADGDLYDRDFYAWTKVQADALRARGGGGNALDYENLAEEVESLGRSDLRESCSRVRTILEHLWKLETSLREEPRPGWRTTIRTQRSDLQDVLTATLRREVETALETQHERAARNAAASLADEEPDAPTLDATRRWTLAQILGESDDPIS